MMEGRNGGKESYPPIHSSRRDEITFRFTASDITLIPHHCGSVIVQDNAPFSQNKGSRSRGLRH